MEKRKKLSTIDLNGQRYNAHTGKLIDASPMHSLRSAVKPMMDIVNPRKNHTSSTTPSKHIHKSTQHSHTLMRRVVKKPGPIIASRGVVAMDVVSVGPVPGSREPGNTEEVTRLKRAHKIQQSALISRFGDVLTRPAGKVPALAAHTPVAPIATSIPQLPAPAQLMPPMPMRKSAASLIADKGLRAANSHAKPLKTKKNRLHHRVGKKLGLGKRAASVAASSLAVLVLGGFIGYQNLPNLAVRYAGVKSGVSATLPGYQPSGFAVSDHVEYSPGEVALSFNANADDRSYIITQKESNWNSEALKEHVTSATGDSPQTYPENGRTIYLYGEANATWVDNGVLYDISGNSSLNTDQLIKIATSM